MAATEMGMDGCGLLIVYGDFKMNQSAAVQGHMANIGPNYPNVTPQQKSVGRMFEDVLVGRHYGPY